MAAGSSRLDLVVRQCAWSRQLGCLLCVNPICNPLRYLCRRKMCRVQHRDLPTGIAALPPRPPRPLHPGSAFALPLDKIRPPLRIYGMQPQPCPPIKRTLGGHMAAAARPETINTDHILTIEQADSNPLDLRRRGTGKNLPEQRPTVDECISCF